MDLMHSIRSGTNDHNPLNGINDMMILMAVNTLTI